MQYRPVHPLTAAVIAIAAGIAPWPRAGEAHAAEGVSLASPSPLAMHAELGFLAMTNSSTTRVPALQLGVGVRYFANEHFGASIGYRGALRVSGNHFARIVYTVHDVPVGGFAAVEAGRARLLATLALLPTLEVSRLSGAGAGSLTTTATTASIGAAADLELGLRATGNAFASLVVGASTRRYYVDFTMLCALEWRL